MTTSAYPLTWPEGWPRMPAHMRKDATFSRNDRRLSVADGVSRVLQELHRLRVDRQDVIVSTGVPTRLDGFPRVGTAEPKDPGAAVYWEKAGKRRVMAIDRYTKVADNLAAIAATLVAMRAIDRHGGAQILDRAFTGFTALPAPPAGTTAAIEPWHQVLNCAAHAPTEDVKAAYRRAASGAHPDKGGSNEAMARVNAAYARFVAERGL